MSNFVVSARKYRPARFDEVVGQQHVSQTLKNALQNNQLAHAFLFCGPRGVGKTTCARILAKVLNCQNLAADHEACDTCNSCKAFNENASFNITELDAASNNSVEHIRALIEQVRFQPQQGKYKVFIIDEVHMLSQQAFNAFLKTLEEPPPYAIFILATTEKHKIIPTILSRCQIFDFRRIQVSNMVSHLQEICTKEQIKADKDALHIIGQKADGALRDSLSIFDRIVSSLPGGEGRHITYNHVIENLNVLDYDYYFRVVDAFLLEDIAQVLLIFDDILKKGFEADIFINGLAEHFRNLLVCKDEQTLALLEASDTLQSRYREQAQNTPESLLLSALNLSNECDINYKMARNKRLHVEMTLIKMNFINRAVMIAQNPVAAAPPLEKKTPDLSKSPETATTNPVIAVPAEPTPAPALEKIEAPIANQTEQTPTPVAAATPTPVAKPKEKAAPAILASEHSTPTILNLDDLEAELDEEETEQQGVIEPLTLKSVENFLKEYAIKANSPSLKTTLNKAIIRLDAENITITVGSPMARGLISDEGLPITIRDHFKTPGLTVKIEIDASKMPVENIVKPKKALTDLEKFQMMREVNPLVQDLLKRFDLKPDN